MLVNRKFIIGKIETQAIPSLALEAREAAFLPILAWMFGSRKLLISLHAPIVGERLPKIGKFLFGSAFGDLFAPRELLPLDPVILALQVFHLGPLALRTVLFPASQCPIVGMTCHPASFPEVDFLFWCWIEPDHVRTIHVSFLLQRSLFQHFLV